MMYTTFVLGAGFSRLAGLPLGNELFHQVIMRARQSHRYRNFVAPDLRRYQQFMRDTTGTRPTLAQITADFEQFISFLDIEHTLGLSGKDTWSPEGNKTQMILRNLIADVLWRAQRRATRESLATYDEFARKLDASDIVITFNYDTLLEESLHRVGKRFRLFPSRMKQDEYGWHLVFNNDEVTILKMHGSIDWFDRTYFERQAKEWALRGHGLPHHEVFASDTLAVVPLVDEPQHEDSPLQRVYRVAPLNWYLDSASMVFTAPVMMSPSFSKILYSNPVKDFWYGFGSGAAYASKVVVIGFSLPPHDEYVKQAVHRLISNFQYGDPTANPRKALLTMVDYRVTPEAVADYRHTYRFVDWRRTKLITSGFTKEAFDHIFDVPAA